MTLCAAVLCDNRKSLIVVADKMVATDLVAGELAITKAFSLDDNWWALVAGEDVDPAFEIIDIVQEKLKESKDPITVSVLSREVELAYSAVRMSEAEALYLRSRGWNLPDFIVHGAERLKGSPGKHKEIDDLIQGHKLKLTLLLAGFDGSGKGHVVSVVNPGRATRHDTPGFYAIGSGAYAAYYMLVYRQMHPRIRLHEALYWTFEAKIFGEDAPLVGYQTDLIVATWRENKCFAKRITKSSEKKLETVWDSLKPRWLKPAQKRRLARLPEVKALHEL